MDGAISERANILARGDGEVNESFYESQTASTNVSETFMTPREEGKRI